VQIWRRSFDIIPPPMEEDHKYYIDIVENPKFTDIQDEIPKVESLKTTMERAIPFWNNEIVPCIKSGKKSSGGVSWNYITWHCKNILVV
ncbi:hypothetical protein L9F63_015007, partial [Diploptera punctata]